MKLKYPDDDDEEEEEEDKENSKEEVDDEEGDIDDEKNEKEYKKRYLEDTLVRHPQVSNFTPKSILLKRGIEDISQMTPLSLPTGTEITINNSKDVKNIDNNLLAKDNAVKTDTKKSEGFFEAFDFIICIFFRSKFSYKNITDSSKKSRVRP